MDRLICRRVLRFLSCLCFFVPQAALAPSGGLANQIQERRPESMA